MFHQKKSLKKLKKHVDYYKSSGMPSSDWVAIALSLAGENITKEPYLLNGESYTDKIEDQVRSKDSLGSLTNYARTTLAVLAGKRDPRNFGGMNLLEGIYEFPDFSQGNNAPGWGLIALSAADVKTPQGVKNTKDYLIDYLLENKAGKAWGLGTGSSDPDITGMIMYSLAPYRDDEEVKAALNEAVEWLDENQMDNGSFSYSSEGDGINTESTAQVILALTSVGIDPQSEMFQVSTGNPVSAMLTNMLDDGSF